MSDRIVFNTRERPLSTDWNNAQAISQRDALDLMGGAAGLSQILGAGAFAETPRNVVLGGLLLTPSGAGFALSTGVLLQYSASLSPTPGTYDSPYRLGGLRSIATIAAPSVGSPTYYLLEGQVSEVTTVTSSRDILDPVTFEFVPTNVPKVVQTTVTTQWVAGTTTNFPAPSGGNWVALAGVLVTGAAPAAADIFDMRPLPEPPVLDSGHIAYRRARIDAGYIANLAVAAQVGGVTVSMKHAVAPAATTGINPDDVLTADPTTPPYTLGASSFSYLYLCPWSSQKLTPRGQYVAMDGAATPTRITSQGVLVFSGVEPSQGGQLNSATLNLPAPFNVATVAAGDAICVASISANGTITYAGNIATLNRAVLSGLLKSWAPMADADTAVLTTSTLIPATAKALDLALTVTPTSGGGINMSIRLTSQAPGVASNDGDVLNSVIVSDDVSAHPNRAPMRCTMPVAPGQTTLEATHTATADDPSATLILTGWRE